MNRDFRIEIKIDAPTREKAALEFMRLVSKYQTDGWNDCYHMHCDCREEGTLDSVYIGPRPMSDSEHITRLYERIARLEPAPADSK